MEAFRKMDATIKFMIAGIIVGLWLLWKFIRRRLEFSESVDVFLKIIQIFAIILAGLFAFVNGEYILAKLKVENERFLHNKQSAWNIGMKADLKIDTLDCKTNDVCRYYVFWEITSQNNSNQTLEIDSHYVDVYIAPSLSSISVSDKIFEISGPSDNTVIKWELLSKKIFNDPQGLELGKMEPTESKYAQVLWLVEGKRGSLIWVQSNMWISSKKDTSDFYEEFEFKELE